MKNVLTRSFSIGLATVAFAGAGCGADERAPWADTSELANAASPLTGTTSGRWNCGHDSGRTCEAILSQPNLGDTVTWDPCLGGAFEWEADVSAWVLGDVRICMGGIATAGPNGGCSAGVALPQGTTIGQASGPLTTSLATGQSWSGPKVKVHATCTEPVLHGVYAPGSGATDQQLITGVDWNELVSTWNVMAEKEMLLSKIEVWYDDDYNVYFDALFTPGKGSYGLNAGMSLASLQSYVPANNILGMEVSDIEAQQVPGGVVYIGVWREGNRQQIVFDGPRSDFEAWVNANHVYVPTHLEVYLDPQGKKRYTAIATDQWGYMPKWRLKRDLRYEELSRVWRQLADDGLHLAELESHHDDEGGALFDALFVERKGDADVVGGARLDHFASKVDEHREDELELVDFDRFKYAPHYYDDGMYERVDGQMYPLVAPAWVAEIERYFRDEQGGPAAGYTVALMKNGELLGATSVGAAARLGTSIPIAMQPETQWELLSITKWVVALAALKLAQDQSIPLTTPILPSIAYHFPLAGAPGSNALWDITLLDAMTHQSGLVNGGCDDGPGTWEQNVKPSAITGSTYSGYNSCMLRLWIQETTGMTFPKYLDQQFLRKIGAHNVDCVKDSEYQQALGYNAPPDPLSGPYENGYGMTNAYCAARGIWGNAFDLLRIQDAVRFPSPVFDYDSVKIIHENGMAFGLNSMFGVSGWASAGAAAGLRTNLAHFNLPGASFPLVGGVDAIFFHNSGTPAMSGGWEQLFEAYSVDPTP